MEPELSLLMTAAGIQCVSLAALAPGRRARICAHPPRGPIPVRLEELGFVPGTRVEILCRAPLGDPIEIEIRGYRVCLRGEDIANLCAVPEATERRHGMSPQTFSHFACWLNIESMMWMNAS